MRMGRPLLAVMMIAATVQIGSLPVVHSQPQDGDCEYFAETGHQVCGRFLEFFQTRGGLRIFGYPLTEAFDDPERGLRVQYFQRARMEFHPYNPDPYQVQLGLLGDELDYLFPPVSPSPGPGFDNSLRRYFPKTGHIVSYSFLRYFREHGGLDIFGYPRSEFMYEDGFIVQYFQRARMEWHPEEVGDSQVRLANLGEIYLERVDIAGEHVRPLELARLEDVPPSEIPDRVTRLEIDASVLHAITGREGEQTVFVYVTDQLERPVPGANVSITVRYEKGDGEKDNVPYECDHPTDDTGFTKCSFEIMDSVPGWNVVIDVMAVYGDLAGTTQTFYLSWW